MFDVVFWTSCVSYVNCSLFVLFFVLISLQVETDLDSARDRCLQTVLELLGRTMHGHNAS